MVIQRTTQAAVLISALLVALFLVRCNDSESVSSPTAPGTSIVMGTVVSGDDASSGHALAGVTVRVWRTSQSTQTDSAGNFTLAGVPGGEQQFQFSRGDIDARATISVIGGATVAVSVAISKRSTVVISPRGNGKPNAPAQTETVTQTPVPGTGTPTAAITPTATPAPGGGKVEEIEGIVTANDGAILTIFDQRLGTVMVTVSSTTIIRKGQKPLTLADILIGWRVHVKALLQTTGLYAASEITVQNDKGGETATNTPTAAAMTNTPTVTASVTSTGTNTPSVTVTPTVTPTATVTVTGTPPTLTPTPTPM